MKYIHGGLIQGRVPAGAIVRIIMGALLLIISLFAFIGFGTEEEGLMVGFIYNIFFIWPAVFLFLFFGFRSLIKSTRGVPRHNLAAMPLSDFGNPFYTVTCERCGITFDYQHSDLGYRAWYRNGYVECPRCRQPIRHNAAQNVFEPEERKVYPYQ